MKMAHNYFDLEDWLVDSPRKNKDELFSSRCLSKF